MPKKDIYDVRFVTGDGPDGYFVKLTQPEAHQVRDVLREYAAAGEITEPEVRLIDESISLSLDQLKNLLGERFREETVKLRFARRREKFHWHPKQLPVHAD